MGQPLGPTDLRETLKYWGKIIWALQCQFDRKDQIEHFKRLEGSIEQIKIRSFCENSNKIK